MSSFADFQVSAYCDEKAIFHNDGCTSSTDVLNSEEMAIRKNPDPEFDNMIFVTSVVGDRMLYVVDTDTGS